VVPSPASQFNKGQQVKVTTVSTQHAVWRQKYEGLTGTVKALNFDCALNLNIESYEVTFKGRTGGVADFAPVELEAA
jgi:ribosomal protein L21E